MKISKKANEMRRKRKKKEMNLGGEEGLAWDLGDFLGEKRRCVNGDEETNWKTGDGISVRIGFCIFLALAIKASCDLYFLGAFFRLEMWNLRPSVDRETQLGKMRGKRMGMEDHFIGGGGYFLLLFARKICWIR